MNTKNKFILCATAVAVLVASQAFATTSATPVANANAVDYALTRNLGSRVVDTQPLFAATFSVEFFSSTGNKFLQQGFGGISGNLAAYAIHTANFADGTYNISLIDFGTTGPINGGAGTGTGQFNQGGSVNLFTDSFTISGAASPSQIYFDFSGLSAVTLSSSNYYGFLLDFSSLTSGNVNVTRGLDVYSGGNIAVGATATTLGFTGAGAGRDQSVAIYTTAVPEPSTAVGIVTGIGLLLMRRVRRRCAETFA